MVKSITLNVPDEKADVCDWLMNETPETTAVVLELTQTVYKMNLMNMNITQKLDVQNYIDCIAEWEMKYKNLMLKNQREMIEIVDKTRKNCGYEYENQLKVLKMRNDELNEYSKNEKEYYMKQLRDISLVKDVEHKNEIDRMNRMFNELQTDKNKLQDEVLNLTKLFTGSASNTGIVGENLVLYVFNTLQLGELDDLRYETSIGCEDYLWTNDDMMCSVEVKNSKCLHSKNDMDKHLRRLDEAVASNKVNCGLFLSLNARVPNMSPLQLKICSGVPVLYVSKCETLSHNTLIELAFRFMNIIWGMTLNKNMKRTDDVDNILEDVANLIESNMMYIMNLEKSIDVIEKNANMTLIQLEKMKKSKDNTLKSISQFRSMHPFAGPKDKMMFMKSPNFTKLVTAMNVFYEKKKKYPKSMNDIKYYLEEKDVFDELVYEFEDNFGFIVSNMKKDPKMIAEMVEDVDESLLHGINVFYNKRKKYPKKVKDVKNYLEDVDIYEGLFQKYNETFVEIVQEIKKAKRSKLVHS